MAGTGRNFGLDLLRVLSIAIVLVNHCFLVFFVWFGGIQITGYKAYLSGAAMISIEWLFGLSGFLIGAMMIRSFEREDSWWHRARAFWLRRWFRTLPTYYLFLIVNILIVAANISPFPAGNYSVAFPFFMQNLAWTEGTPLFFSESWSLALDEWFYLIMPLLVGLAAFVVFRKNTRNAFLAAALVLIIVPTVLRFLSDAPFKTHPLGWDHEIRRITIFHLDATGYGVLAAILSRWWSGFWTTGVKAKAMLGAASTLVGLGLVEGMVYNGLHAPLERFTDPTVLDEVAAVFSISFIGIGTVLLMPWIASLRSPGRRWAVGVEHVSNYTYSIYLCHFPVMYVLLGAIGAKTGEFLPMGTLAAQSLVWILMTVGVAALVYHSFEKPISDLRERYTRKVDASPFATKTDAGTIAAPVATDAPASQPPTT